MIGNDGFQGIIGNIGKTGIEGNPGKIGPQGLAGNVGIPGQNGKTGPIGYQGIKGPIGEQGFSGIDGPIGLTGPTGSQGAKGPQGPPGSIIRGDPGRPGYDGFLSTNQKNNLIDYVKDHDISKLIKKSNSPIDDNYVYCPISMGKENAIANGIVGIYNYQGQRHISLNCTYVNMLYNDNFYTTQGVISINEPFDQGNLGASGVKGFTGQPGYQGNDGPIGLPGKPGPTGPPGTPGNDGPQGIQGVPGKRGQHGPPGNNGKIGSTGDQGPRGPVGNIGPRSSSYKGPGGSPGYTGDISVNFSQCKNLTYNRGLIFECPDNSWLTGLNYTNGYYTGLCCPLVIRDNEIAKPGDIGLDGKPYPKEKKYKYETMYNKQRLDNINNYTVNNNNNNIRSQTSNTFDFLIKNTILQINESNTFNNELNNYIKKS